MTSSPNNNPRHPGIATLETAALAPADPLALFHAWMTEAEARETVDPNAMSLATVDADGKPSVRIVLLKALDERGFVFYTNRESRKGEALTAKPLAALCFHWKSLDRQVRVEGTAEPVSDAKADAYYRTRSRGSRLGAWASLQSRPLESRSTLADRLRDYDREFNPSEQSIPRPPHWGGYRIKPETIEFWHEGRNRLHTRLLYTRDETGWKRGMLYP